MKNIKLIILVALILTINYSCKKFDKDDNPDIADTENDMKDIVVPDGFKWETTATNNFYLTGGFGEVVRITSEDETVVYHKGTYIEENGIYSVDLRLPSHLNSVKINSVSVDLMGGVVYYDLSTNKSSLVNYALEFDGVDDYVDFGDIVELNSVQTFTVEGLAYDYLNTDSDYIFSKIDDATNDFIIRTDAGTMIIEIGNGFDTYATWADYSTDPSTSAPQWFHWAVVYDGFAGISNSDKLKLYIDGTQKVLVFTNGPVPGNTANLASNSAILSSSLGYFNGFMDEIRIWDDVRTPTEIDDNKDVKILDPNADASLIAYYRMDTNSGSTLFDTQGNYDATIYGSADWATYINMWDSDDDGIEDIDDDYWDDPLRAHDNYYPSGDTGTVVFEDLWPGTGDYDFNDLVIGYQFKTVTSATNRVTEIYCFFEVRAHGAQLDNGFGFQLPGATSGVLPQVVVTGYSHTQGMITIDGITHFETGQTYPVVIVMDRVADFMDKFQNTDDWQPTIPYVPLTVILTAPLDSDLTASDFDMENWDPFMFVDQKRGYEVHKIDMAPTSLVDLSYFGTIDDVSVPGDGKYYRTSTGLPWALEFPTTFEYPFEKKYITIAYLHFRAWAEGNTSYNDWYSNTSSGYRNTSYIYN